MVPGPPQRTGWDLPTTRRSHDEATEQDPPGRHDRRGVHRRGGCRDQRHPRVLRGPCAAGRGAARARRPGPRAGSRPRSPPTRTPAAAAATTCRGVGNLETGARVPLDGQVRIGSNTKTFVAVTLLQLVDEGTVELDAPIETYLPGLVHGDGVDGTPHHRPAAAPAHQRRAQLHRGDRPGLLRYPATVRRAARAARPGADAAGHAARVGVGVQQHQLRHRRPDRRRRSPAVRWPR